jgi:putative transcriptional regulator
MPPEKLGTPGPDKPKPKLVTKIRKLRFDHDEMTQQALADQVGVTRQTILALEAGRYMPSLLLAHRIAQAFEARIEEVFEFVETE